MKKISKNEKMQRGTYASSRDKSAKGLPVLLISKIPGAPAHLTASAAEIFRATCQSLKNARKLTADTLNLIADYSYFSDLAAVWQQRSEKIDQLMGESFDPVMMRKFVAANRLSRQNSSHACKLASQLGILPGDRNPERDQDDSFEREFLQ